jgi:hypothetical protein
MSPAFNSDNQTLSTVLAMFALSIPAIFDMSAHIRDTLSAQGEGSTVYINMTLLFGPTGSHQTRVMHALHRRIDGVGCQTYGAGIVILTQPFTVTSV